MTGSQARKRLMPTANSLALDRSDDLDVQYK